ncbi:hypothetical protein NL676_019046 [Syzygium grande]|nr:hypothetical protein NL676_019046 [Syzygium grande]
MQHPNHSPGEAAAAAGFRGRGANSGGALRVCWRSGREGEREARGERGAPPRGELAERSSFPPGESERARREKKRSGRH